MRCSHEELLKLAEESGEKFSRNMACEVSSLEEEALAVSRFVDRFHDITLSMLVDRRTFRVTEAYAVMDRVPYAVCREALEGVGRLKGLSIYHRAVRREARRRIPRKEGCTHLFELIEFTLASLFSGAPLAGLENENTPRKMGNIDEEEHRLKHLDNSWFKNTCRAFVPDEEQ